MKPIPNRQKLLARQAANTPKTPQDVYEFVYDEIVDSIEGGAINAGQVLFDTFAFAISPAVESRLCHVFYAKGYDLHILVTRNGYRRTLIYLEKAPHATV